MTLIETFYNSITFDGKKSREMSLLCSAILSFFFLRREEGPGRKRNNSDSAVLVLIVDHHPIFNLYNQRAATQLFRINNAACNFGIIFIINLPPDSREHNFVIRQHI